MNVTTRILSVIAVLAIAFGGFTAVPAAPSIPWQAKVDPWVVQTSAQGETEFLVFLAQQADLSHASALKTKLEKGTYVYETLTEIADRTQPAVIAALKARGAEYRPYWVANMIWVRGGADLVQAMAERSDVAHIYANPKVKLEQPEIAPGSSSPDSPEAVEWNINWVNAPAVWAAGFTGQGVVVAGQDTGYQWDHPALINQYRGWDGSNSDHNYNWHDAIHEDNGTCQGDSPEPCDDYGHGTHTMGTMVGDDGGSNQIGMAPGARWIGCRNMNDGVGTPESYSECYQWFIAPTDLNGDNADPSMAPDAINNSWGCPVSEGCTDPNVMLTIVENVVAAGILTNHSAGNAGSSCSSIAEPAAIYDASFTVGATGDHTDNIASYSSRGPVTVDGSGRMKPDISAPGSNIRSSVPGSGYQGGWSGTSMAGPHVTGLVALLISAAPGLEGQVSTLENVIEQSAVPRTTNQGCGGDGNTDVPNNVYGWGRIDALAAFESIYQDFQLTKTASAPTVVPGEAFTYTIQLTNASAATAAANVVLTDTLPLGTNFVSATEPYSFDGSTVEWDLTSLDPLETFTATLAVNVDSSARGSVVNAKYAASSDEIPPVWGAPVTTTITSSALGLAKTAPPAVLPGEIITYTLTVSNPYDNVPVNNVIVTDTIPEGTTFVTATLPYTLDSDTITWEVPSLLPSAGQSFELVVQAPMSGTVTNAAYGAIADETDPAQGTPVETMVMPYTLELAKSAPESVAVGDLLTYTLTVTNPHPAAITHNLVLTDVLPEGTTFITATQPYSMSGDTVSWTASELAPLSTWITQLVVRVPVTFTGSVVNEDYAVRSDEVEGVAGAPVTTHIHALALSKTASTQAVSRGDLLTYTLNVTNLHPLSITHDLVLTDTLPVGTAFISASLPYTITGNVVTWTADSLEPGEIFTATLTIQVLPEASEAVVNDIYYVTSAEVTTPIFGAPVVTPFKFMVYLPQILNGASSE